MYGYIHIYTYIGGGADLVELGKMCGIE